MWILQGSWGKRYAPDDAELLPITDLENLIEMEQDPLERPQYPLYGLGSLERNDDEKRAWQSLNGGWGKRAETNWNNFRGR